ncbi:hypothetical protein ACFVHW_36055 [Streptomyces sp. NPDC127110]|uniref:hypothetical protein n=1 Tax=Streptomyces sp. NPDC127110 TaxID=3345362 RepID=UPI003638D98F
MAITLRPGSTVMFTGDSITDCQRLESEDGLGFGYPHPRRRRGRCRAHRGARAEAVAHRCRTRYEDRAGVLAADGVHPTPAGHAALAAAWPRLVA